MTRKLYIGAQNDTRYFIDQPPRPSTDDANHDADVNVIASWNEITQALAAAGYAVVPVEPTEAMMVAGDNTIKDSLERAQVGLPPEHPNHASHNVYKAMIAATQDTDR